MTTTPTTISKRGFVLYCDQKLFFERLSDAESKALLLAIFDYEHDGTEPTFANPVVDMAFLAIRQTLDRNRAKHLSISEQRREFGAKGGLAKARKAKQRLANVAKAKFGKQTLANPSKATDTETDTESDTETITPLPPEGDVVVGLQVGSRKRMTAADKQRCRVKANTPLMQRIGAWFGRGPETLWTVYEAEALAQMESSLTEKEISGMEAYYTAETVGDIDARRRNVATLLNNWPGELDRARAYYRETKNGKTHGNRPAEPVIMGSG